MITHCYEVTDKHTNWTHTKPQTFKQQVPLNATKQLLLKITNILV